MFWRQALGFVALSLLLIAATASVRAGETELEPPGQEPFLWRNASPVSATLGLPRARGGALPRQGELHMDLLLDVASHFTRASSSNESVLLDGETATLVARFERGFGEHWAGSVELAGLRHSGGVLDGLIDRWHNLFGLPDGGRDSAPRDRLRMVWSADGTQRLLLEDTHTGVGDLRVGAARALHRSPARDLALRVDLELPTGSARRLAGSGGVDVAAGLALTEREAFAAFGLLSHFTAGVLRPSGNDLVGGRLRTLAGYGSWTLVWPVSERLSLKAQLDGHSELVRSELKQIGGWSVQGALGGSWRFGPGLAFEFALYEDLRVATAPDVTFQFALRGRY